MAVDATYARTRALHRDDLRTREAPRYDALPPEDRLREVGLLRAIGAVFGQFGTPQEKAWARAWLLGLLDDPQEKIRRYAIQGLPKLNAGPAEERALLSLLDRAASPRERAALHDALEKIGGRASLDAGVFPGDPALSARLHANAVRSEQSGHILLDQPLTDVRGLRLHLRCRRGLEGWLREEWEAHPVLRSRFRGLGSRPGLLALAPLGPFSLGDVFQLRTFATLGLAVGRLSASPGTAPSIEALAQALTSPLVRRIYAAFHQGPPRYRIDFPETAQPPKPAFIRAVAAQAFSLHPGILNDSHQAPWSADIHPAPGGLGVELRPRLSPDPRFAYRLSAIPAASHPPLAAALARWAAAANGPLWDPFCGSGLELVECGLLGHATVLHGSDLDPAALDACRANLAAAGLGRADVRLAACDFRDYPRRTGLLPGSLSVIITNPPLGRRIRIPGLRQLIADLFQTAATCLRPGGRLILANPTRIDSPPPGLRLEERRMADLGGFDCRLEHWCRVR
jgi:hypothetical protein